MIPTDRYTQESALAAVDETLRLLASQPAPEGLEDRLQRQLKTALHSAPRPGVFAWVKDELAERFRFLSLDGATMRAVAAVAIVAVVLGGGWSVFSRVQLAPQGSAIQQRGGGGFSSAGAIRTPQNIEVMPPSPWDELLAQQKIMNGTMKAILDILESECELRKKG